MLASSVKRTTASTTTAADIIAWLEKHASKKHRDGMARYAIPSGNALGIPVGALKTYAKTLGRNHHLALPLWDTGIYEARMLVAWVADPALVTSAQMDAWRADFDSWAICDHLCFHLFDRTPHAIRKVEQWSKRRDEFGKRAAFALLASLALHDKRSPDEPFLRSLPLIERAADDDRNFVKKGVSWALRLVGRRSLALNEASVALSKRLAASDAPAAVWIAKDALKELTNPAVLKRIKK
jgi:3-methyladenine DNA glycosylase AlkD